MTNQKADPIDPAKRLLNIFEKAKITNAANIGVGYMAVFNIANEDYNELYRKLGIAGRTAQEIAELLHLSGNDLFEKTFRNDHLPMIRQNLSPRHLDFPWEEFKKRILDRDITALRMCSHILEREFPETLIPVSELNGLLIEVETLYTDVLLSHLPNDLKKIILQNLHNIKTAIHDYAVRGVEGLQEALAIVLGTGEIGTNETHETQSDLNSENGPEKPHVTLADKFARVVDLLTKMIALGNAGKPLLLKAYHILRPLLPG